MKKSIISSILCVLLTAGMILPVCAEDIEEANIINEEAIVELEENDENIVDIEASDVTVAEYVADDFESDEVTDGETEAASADEFEGEIENAEIIEPEEVVEDGEGVIASRKLNNFNNKADWVNSWSEAVSYADRKVSQGNGYISFWVNGSDSSESQSLMLRMAMKGYGGMSAWGSCPSTSPFPNGTCMQFYTPTWFEANIPGYAGAVSATEVTGGVKVKWTKGSNGTAQKVVVYDPSKGYGLGYNVASSATEYLYTVGQAGKSYFITVYTENSYGWSETDSVKITCSKDGKDYKCNHRFANAPTFKWSSDRKSCNASSYCSVCNKTITNKCTVKKIKSKKASFTEDGYIQYEASTNAFNRTYTETKKKIYKKASVKLSKKSYGYKGKACKPAVKVLDSDGKEISSDWYDVVYSNNKKPGTAKVTVTFKTLQSGVNPYSGEKVVKFNITLIKPVVTKKTAKSKGFRVEFEKVPGAKSYQIEYATSSSFSNKVTKSTSNNYLNASRLKANKKYYIRVRAICSGLKSKYSDTIVIKTK